MTPMDIQHIEEVYNDIKRRQQVVGETADGILTDARVGIECALSEYGYRIVDAGGTFQIERK